MIGLIEAAREVVQFMDVQGWRYCFIGGLALQLWGEPRSTGDVDLTVLTDWGNEEQFIDPLLQHFRSRIPDAKAFGLRNRVLLLLSARDIPIDISLGALLFEREMIERCRITDYTGDLKGYFCTAEDLVVMKSFASRPQDWIDVEGIVVRQSKLDKAYILKHLKDLCELKESPEILHRVEELLGK